LFVLLPQNDLLALGPHLVRVFLTHGGINSLLEAAYHGVPVVTLPLMADQLDNAMRAEELGMGVTVHAVHQKESPSEDEVFLAITRWVRVRGRFRLEMSRPFSE
jgi:UDP:flavonoid glycosyltransferase YjiC (YdhE family)